MLLFYFKSIKYLNTCFFSYCYKNKLYTFFTLYLVQNRRLILIKAAYYSIIPHICGNYQLTHLIWENRVTFWFINASATFKLKVCCVWANCKSTFGRNIEIEILKPCIYVNLILFYVHNPLVRQFLLPTHFWFLKVGFSVIDYKCQCPFFFIMFHKLYILYKWKTL